MIFWYIPGPEFFACRVRRRVGRAFRIEEKAFHADATPKFRDCNRVESHCLCIQGHYRERSAGFAAAMRRRHLHLTALVLHHAAAGALLSAHLRIRNHAGHCRGQT